MKTYRVTWEIDIESESPKTAAEAALRVQRDETSIAVFFEVAELDKRGVPSKYITPVDLELSKTSDTTLAFIDEEALARLKGCK